MTLSIVNWNVEFATPRSWRTHLQILSRVGLHIPEIVCLTETHDELLSSIMATRYLLAAGLWVHGSGQIAGRSLLWSKKALGSGSMIWGLTRCRRDGLCRAMTQTSVGEVAVYWGVHPLVWIADRGSPRGGTQEAVAGSRAVPGRPY